MGLWNPPLIVLPHCRIAKMRRIELYFFRVCWRAWTGRFANSSRVTPRQCTSRNPCPATRDSWPTPAPCTTSWDRRVSTPIRTQNSESLLISHQFKIKGWKGGGAAPTPLLHLETPISSENNRWERIIAFQVQYSGMLKSEHVWILDRSKLFGLKSFGFRTMSKFQTILFGFWTKICV